VSFAHVVGAVVVVDIPKKIVIIFMLCTTS
jgi:hypothetical protein